MVLVAFELENCRGHAATLGGNGHPIVALYYSDIKTHFVNSCSLTENSVAVKDNFDLSPSSSFFLVTRIQISAQKFKASSLFHSSL